jgi:hypothetical protein
MDAAPSADASSIEAGANDSSAAEGGVDASLGDAGPADTGTVALDAGAPDASTSPVVAIHVHPTSISLGAGAKILFSVTATLADGSGTVEPPTAVTWTFSQPGIVVAQPDGWLRADASGSVSATANVGRASAMATINVVQLKVHAWAQTKALSVRPVHNFHTWGQSNVSVNHP